MIAWLSQKLAALWAALVQLWARIPVTLRPLLLLLIGALAVLWFVRPFGSRQEDRDSAAGEWNATISRLGLQAVYPPEEDLYVGDIWASVVDSCGKNSAAEGACQTPFRGEAVRLYHLDLSKQLQTDPTLPVFEDTPFEHKEDEYRVQQTEAKPPKALDGVIRLSFAGFPGIVSDRVLHRSGSAGWSAAAFWANHETVEHEQISIPIAETYGVRAEDGFIDFDNFCTAKETTLYCKDNYVRRLMSFIVGDEILRVKDGHYVQRLQIQLIIRAFLARQLIVKHTLTGADGVTIATSQADAEGAESNPAKGAASATFPDAQASAKSGSTEGGGDIKVSSGVGGLWTRRNERDVTTDQVYQRPLVFGFRAVTFAIIPSCPKAVNNGLTCG